MFWNLPEDNGEQIDFFEITFFPVEYVGGPAYVAESDTSLGPQVGGGPPTPPQGPHQGGGGGGGAAGGSSGSVGGAWQRVGNIFRTEVPNPGNVRYELQDLYPDTYHMIEIRAHNALGYSAVSAIVIRTAKGKWRML